MSAKHTPAPWLPRSEVFDSHESAAKWCGELLKASPSLVVHWVEVEVQGEPLVVALFGNGPDGAANAVLAAAAPDLLAACEAMEACGPDATDEEITRICDANRAAIAKAKGGAR